MEQKRASAVETRSKTRVRRLEEDLRKDLPSEHISFRPKSHLLVSVGEDIRQRFIEGYQKDPFFRDKWEKAGVKDIPQFTGQCFLRDGKGLLYLRREEDEVRLCIPKSEVAYVLSHLHDLPYESAHEGPEKFAKRICGKFYWPTLLKDAKSYVDSCDVCQKIKPDRRRKPGLLRPNPVPDLPYEWVSFDLITGLPFSGGFDAIFVAVDCLSKHAQFVPCAGKINTMQMAKLFLNTVVFRFGLPEHIIADRDARWTSSFWKSLAGYLNLHMALSSSHHPQHDGQTERTNQTLEIMLRAYVKGNRKDWSDWLPFLQHSYNSSVHSATGKSPYFLLYGYEPRGPLDFLPVGKQGISRSNLLNHSAEQFATELEVQRDMAKSAITMAQEKAARAFNKNRRTVEFPVGSLVLINPHSLHLVDVKGTGKKLMQCRLGPFVVQEVINPNMYRLSIPDTFSMNPIFNAEHLSAYKSDEDGEFSSVE